MPLYFLRHGESEANEQNLFAGRLDSPLTRLGKEQAKKAQRQIAKAGIVFDEIHTSPLTRAQDTGAAIASAQEESAPVAVVSAELLERDFGVLSENNKTLIKKHFGYEEYDSMFHSAEGAPPDGESFHQLYDRIATYHHEVLEPLAEAGKTVLVVAHKYPIEMFALLAAGMSPDAYKDLKVPNSKPSSFEDLGRHAGNVVESVDWLGEMIEIHLPALLAAGLAVGIALKALLLTTFATGAAAGPLESRLFFGALLLFTGVNSFFVFLRTPPETVRGAGGVVRRFWAGTAIRTALAMALIFGVRTPLAEAAGLFLMVPPTMAVPTLSLMWGGNYFLSVQLSLGLWLVAPVLMSGVYLLAHGMHLPMTMDLVPFLVLFAGGVVLPGVLSQGLRRAHAIKAGSISTNWAWIGGAALIPLALSAGFYFVTPQVLAALATPPGIRALTLDIVVGLALLLAVRACGFVSNRCVRITKDQSVDGYLCNIAPNIFFWCSLTATSNGLFSLALLVLYFGSLWLEDRRFVRRYAQGVDARAKAQVVSDTPTGSAAPMPAPEVGVLVSVEAAETAAQPAE